MRKIAILFLLLFAHFFVQGQAFNISLSQGDTAICKGSSVSISSSFYRGSFKYIGSNGVSDYFIDTISRSWTAGRAEAQLNGMDLWVIDSVLENNQVYNFIPNRTKTDVLFWFGLYQDPALEAAGDATKGWFWIDGRSLDTTFQFWNSGEPNDNFGINIGANFASLGLNTSGSKWSDMTDNLPAQYSGYAIAEIPHTTLTYSWINSTSTSSSITVAPAVETSYTVSITYNGNTVTSNTVKISVNLPKAIAGFSIDPSSVYCKTQNNIVFTNTTSTTDPNTTYFWNFGDGFTSDQNFATHQYSGNQSYSVTLTAIDGNSCKTTLVNPVVILASPTNPIITYNLGSNVFCEGDSVRLTTTVPQSNPVVYNWYRGSLGVGSGDFYWAKLGGNYSLEAVNTNGCKDTSLILVTVNPLPTKPSLAVLTGFSSTFCQTDSTKIEATTSAGISKYSWYTGSVVTPTIIVGASQKIYVAKAPAGIGQTPVSVSYLVRAIDTKNCISPISDPIVLTTKPSPSSVITAGGLPTTFCESDSVTLYLASPVAGELREWSRDNVFLISNVNNIVVKTTGVYRLKVTNSFSCPVISNPISVLVNKFPVIPTIIIDPTVPEITSGGVVNICTGTNTILRTPSVSGGVYQWYQDGIAITNAKAISVTINKAGKYKVITTVSGCATPSLETTVGLLNLPAGILATPPVTTICDGYDVTLNASNAFGYQWYLNSTKIIGATSPVYIAKVPGLYKVEFFTDKGCKNTSLNFANLTLIKKPTPNFTYDLYCINVPSTITNQSITTNSGTVDYLWKFQNGTTDNAFNTVHTFPTAGIYKVTLKITPVACPQLADSLSANINVEVPGKGISYIPINAMLGKPISLIARSIGDLYQWKPSTGLSSPFIKIPLLTPTTEQLYTVDIINRAGCLTTDSLLIRIFDEQDVFIAGGFTPNNDGQNDRIYPMLAGIASFKYLKIFNRWGNIVYQSSSTDPAQGWDGKFKGKDQPADTYTWILEAVGENDRPIKKSGSLILIR
jgi:gliding motility-associated-like protein